MGKLSISFKAYNTLVGFTHKKILEDPIVRSSIKYPAPFAIKMCIYTFYSFFDLVVAAQSSYFPHLVLNELNNWFLKI
jgi:hypothetical protein